MGGRLSRFVVALSVVSMAVGCGGGAGGGTAEPVVIGSIPPDTGAPLGRDIETLDESGLTAFDLWPSACDLIADDALEDLFPEAVGIVKHPEPRKITVLVIGGENRTETVPAADCTIRVGLPQEGLGLESDNGGVRFNTSVVAVGEEEAVARMAGDAHGDPVDGLGDYGCFTRDPFYVTCDLGTFVFRIGVDLRAHGQYVGSPDSPYVMNGTTVVHTGGAERDAFITDNVLIPVVESALARDV